jgi:single-strand DNA-binding protein
MLIGNVGNDPEVRATPNGARVAQLNLATTRTWNGPGGDKQEKTEWHRCVLWNGRASGTGLADVVERYVKKGDRLYIEGSIECLTARYSGFGHKKGPGSGGSGAFLFGPP